MYLFFYENNVVITNIVDFRLPHRESELVEFLKGMPKRLFNYIFDGVIKKKDLKDIESVCLSDALIYISSWNCVAIRAVMDDGTVVYGVDENLNDAIDDLKRRVQKNLKRF